MKKKARQKVKEGSAELKKLKERNKKNRKESLKSKR